MGRPPGHPFPRPRLGLAAWVLAGLLICGCAGERGGARPSDPRFGPGALLAALDRNLAERPADVAALVRRGRLLGELGRTGEALADLLRAAELAATARVPRQLGKELWDGGHRSEARRVWEVGLQRFPADTVLRRNVALALYEAGDYGGAEREFRRLLEAAPDSAGARADLAWALLRMGRTEEARRLAEEALRIEPTEAGARGVLERLGAGGATP